MAYVMSVAFHEPKKIDEVLKPSVRETAHRAENDPDAWDHDEWWKNT